MYVPSTEIINKVVFATKARCSIHFIHVYDWHFVVTLFFGLYAYYKAQMVGLQNLLQVLV